MKKKKIILSTLAGLIISMGTGAGLYLTLTPPVIAPENIDPDEEEEEITPGEETDPEDEGEGEAEPEEEEEEEEVIEEEETNYLETLAEAVELYKDTDLEGIDEIFAQNFRDALAEAIELLEIGIEPDDQQVEFNLRLAYIMLGIY